RKALACVDHHAGYSNRRVPEEKRLFHPGRAGLGQRRARPAGALAAVRPAVGNHGPAIVLSGLNDVDLVAAERSILCGPQLAGLWVDDQANRVADAEGVQLWLVALSAGERVIWRRTPIVV